MRKVIFKKLSTMALSAALLLAGLGVTAQASNQHVCTRFTVWYTYDADFVNPNEHWVYVIRHVTCDVCGEGDSGVVDEYMEGHDYVLDYETNMLICSGCGDSYGYSR